METPAFQRRSWTLQRCGWIVMAAIIAAALLGIFGAGPLSRATRSTDDGSLRIDYERFWRMNAPTELRLHLAGNGGDGDQRRVWISRSWLDAMQVDRIVPAPRRVSAEGDRIVFLFDVAGTYPTSILLMVEPRSPGRLRASVGIDDGLPLLQFSQFIYP